jgi:hypothetical protein
VYSRKYALTWKAKGTKYNRLLFQLSPLERRTDGTEFGLLLTPTQIMIEETPEEYRQRMDKAGYKNGNQWNSLASQISHGILPTPTTRDFRSPDKPESGNFQRKVEQGYTIDLNSQIAILGTPTSRDWKDVGNMENVPVNGLLGRQLGANNGLKLQPAFVEWMMGFPIGWTKVNERPSITPSDTSAGKKLSEELDLICKKLNGESKEQSASKPSEMP